MLLNGRRQRACAPTPRPARQMHLGAGCSQSSGSTAVVGFVSNQAFQKRNCPWLGVHGGQSSGVWLVGEGRDSLLLC